MIAHLRRTYEENVRESRNAYNGIVWESNTITETRGYKGDSRVTNKREGEFIRGEGLSRNGTSRILPKDSSVTPLCSSGSVFIRIDSKTLKQWGFECSNDPWWYSSVIDPFSKKTKIECLSNKENSTYASTQDGFLSCLLGN